MESIEYPVMSGSNTICVATVLLETGMIDAVEPVTHLVLESAAGLIAVECQVCDACTFDWRLTPGEARDICALAERIKIAAAEQLTASTAGSSPPSRSATSPRSSRPSPGRPGSPT